MTPPFKGSGIRRWGRSKDKNKDEYREGNCPFGFDFNNYTIGYLLPKRGNYNFEDPEYVKVKSNMWWRIYKLGYSFEDFGEIDKEIARYSDRFGHETDGRKIDRYGKKYCWIAWHEIAGFRQDKGLLKREWASDYERFTIDIDPSFPEEIQKVEIIKADYLGRRKTSLPNWIVKGPTPEISPYLILDDIQGEKGPWVLLDGFIEQEDLAVKREIFIFSRGLFIRKNNFSDVIEHLKRQDLGGRWLPEIPEYRQIFTGEVPWCDTFPYNEKAELIFVVAEKKKRIPFEEPEFTKGGRSLYIEELKELSEVVSDYQCKKISEKELDDFFKRNKIKIRRVKQFKTETVRETKEYEAVIPISTLNWESQHSIANPGMSAYVLSRELCEALGLSSRPQTFDLYDKTNRRGSITLKWGDEWHTYNKLVYLRKDLLDGYLQKLGLELVWGIWGERRFKSKDNAGLHDFAEKYQAYKVFQKVITYDGTNLINQR